MRFFVLASLTVVSALASAQSYHESHTDDWDISRGTVVTSHSGLDHDPPAGDPYDIRDLFGGHFGTYANEPERVVFHDGSGGIGFVDFVEWESPSALAIKRFTMAWADDNPGNNWRNLAHFSLFGKLNADDSWTSLSGGDTPQQVGEGAFSATLAGDPYKYWRAQFTRGFSSNLTATGARVYEIDGWVDPVPEPASLAALGMGTLALLRRRRKRA